MAASTVNAVTFTGMPEAAIPLAFCCVFLATSPKSNAAYKALNFAKHDVLTKPLGPVPLHLRNYDFTREKKKGEYGYKYPHDFPGHWVAQDYLPPELAGAVYYKPSDQGHEARIAERMAQLRAAKKDTDNQKPEKRKPQK